MATEAFLAMHRVLASPEILRAIFTYLNHQSNVNNAVVCKIWSDVALNELWRKVDNLPRLFHLLVPLNKSHTHFSQHPTATDWVSFQRYTKRVRSLTYDEDKDKLSTKMYNEIARTRTTMNIFPNLQELCWRASLPFTVLFMTPTVKCLDIWISVDTTEEVLRMLADDIVGRMPNLVALGVHNATPPPPKNVIKNGIIQLLSPLRQLQKLSIPRFVFTARLAELLSSFPRLAHIIFEYVDEDRVGDPDAIKKFKPALPPGAFVSLVDICLCSNYGDSERFIGLLSSPSILTDIVVESPMLETPPMVYHLLDTISKKCHQLKEMVLNSPRREGDNNAAGERISLKDLKPLFACKNLTVLEIYHQYPLDLRLEDLERLARKLPFLTHIHLNDEPGHFEFPELTLEALFPFARHCLNLKGLGLFINASSDAIPNFHPISPPPLFSKLQQLSMGTSKITSAMPVAMFLSHILPNSCHIYSGISYSALFNLGAKSRKLVEEREKLWDEVNPSVSLFIKIREEERDKARVAMQKMEREKKGAIGKVKQELDGWRRATAKKEE